MWWQSALESRERLHLWWGDSVSSMRARVILEWDGSMEKKTRNENCMRETHTKKTFQTSSILTCKKYLQWVRKTIAVMTTKDERQSWQAWMVLWHFSHALPQLNFMYKLVPLPSHLGNWAYMTTKLPADHPSPVSGLIRRGPKSKSKCSFLWDTNTDS